MILILRHFAQAGKLKQLENVTATLNGKLPSKVIAINPRTVASVGGTVSLMNRLTLSPLPLVTATASAHNRSSLTIWLVFP